MPIHSQTQRIWIPSTTSKTVVFPWNKDSNTFKTESYEPSMTNGQISHKRVDQFVHEMNAEYKLYNKSLEDDNDKYNCLGYLLFLILLVDFFILSTPSRNPGMFTNGEIIILTWFFFFFVQRLCGENKPEATRLSELKEKCQDIADKQNESLRSLDLKWHLPAEFPAWIELTQDKEKQNYDVEIPSKHLIPDNTPSTVIFPRQRYKFSETWRFSHEFLSPDMTAGRISLKEAQEFFSEINGCLRTPYKESYKRTFRVFLCLSFELFGLFYISNHFPDLLTTSRALIIAAVSVVGVIYLSLGEIKKDKENEDLHFKLGSQRIVDKYNETLRNHGLRWHLPDQFPLWIELCREYHEGIQLVHMSSGRKSSDSLSLNPQDDAEAQRLNDKLQEGFHKDMYAPLLEGENSKSLR